jgi:hypothetical protein
MKRKNQRATQMEAESPEQLLKKMIIPGDKYLAKTVERLARRAGFSDDQATRQLTLLINEGFMIESNGIGISGDVKCYQMKPKNQ